MTAIKGVLRKSGVSALITTLILLVALDQAAPAFHITSVYRDQGQIHMVYESDSAGYFLGMSGTSVTEVATAIDIELGQSGNGMLMEPDANPGGFYAVLRVPRDAPQDTDGDGMDDVFELECTFLRPLDPDDAYRDQDKDGISNLGEYRLGSDPDDPTSGPVAAATADTDDDGYPDAYETVHGSDLDDSASLPAPILSC